jgi:D-alanyl-D-alanine carboxypeptidase (penicillin-binding protein 5/6)
VSLSAALANDDLTSWVRPRRQLSAVKARQRRIYRRRRAAVLAVFAVLVSGIAWLVSGPGLPRLLISSDPGKLTQRPVPLPRIVPTVAATTTFPGTPAALPIPSTGQSAVYVQGIGVLGATPAEQSVPMASVTKVMTAIIVLHDHPLGNGSGPTFTMTASDNAAYVHDATNDDSNLLVVAGERLSERKLLEALMIPSADNIADYLARWDAGSTRAFVRKMNAMAAALGLKHTHYADASGLNPDSRSTAIDQAILGAYAIDVPGMISVEDHPTMDFPIEGAVINYNPVVGQDGVIGLKSGFTSASQGCLVTAARRFVGGRKVLIMSSTLGQPFNLAEEGEIDLRLLGAATADLKARRILSAYQPVGEVVAGWSRERPDVVVTAAVTAIGWGGLVVATVVKATIPPKPATGRGWKSGTTMAIVELTTPAGVQFVARAKLSRFFSAAPLGWSPSRVTSSTAGGASHS